MIKERQRIPCHDSRPVVFRAIQFGALAVAPVVVGDHAISSIVERLDPTWIDPVEEDIGGEPVDQQDGVATARPLVDEGDLDPVMKEGLHWSYSGV